MNHDEIFIGFRIDNGPELNCHFLNVPGNGSPYLLKSRAR